MRRQRETASTRLRELPLGLLLHLLMTLPVYALRRRIFPPAQLTDRVSEVRLLG